MLDEAWGTALEWHNWFGGDCPVAPETKVEVCFDGRMQRADKAGTWDWTWLDDGHSGDITKYRIVSEKAVQVSDKEQTISVQELVDKIKPGMAVQGGKVVSDGGSSSYYKLTITNKAGETINCEMGDIIRCVYGNDFNLGNIVKAARRVYEASQGRGKQDVTIEYDCNKMKYFSDEFAAWNKP